MNGINVKNAITILNAATSTGEKTSNPFLIKKKENPQIMDKPKKTNQSNKVIVVFFGVFVSKGVSKVSADINHKGIEFLSLASILYF